MSVAATRRSVLIGAASLAVAAVSPAAAAPRVALVYDATRFKIRRPARLADFWDEALFRGPRAVGRDIAVDAPEGALRFDGTAAVAALFDERRVALALVAADDAPALLADARLGLA